MKPDIRHGRLLEALSYSSETGIFLWKNPASSAAFLGGKEAGTINGDGYRQIMIDGKLYQAHRLAWLYVFGAFPGHRLDHVNGIKTDNRILNLREVTPSQNMMNSPAPKSNSTGFKNVSKNRGGFLVCVRANKKSSSKWFPSLPEAAAHAEALRASLHGEFAYNSRKQVGP
ncbi:HNH endonuclease [Pseudomonas reactans]